MQKCSNETCGRAGDDAGTCGSFVTCPRSTVDVQPGDVVIHCDRCEITRAVPAGRIIQGRGLPSAHYCPVAICEAKPVILKKAKSQPAQEPATDGQQEG